MTQAVIEAMTGAVGELNNDFCGLRITRLLADTPAGSSILDLERTYDWPATGRVSIDGAVYHYTANNDGNLSGVYYLSGGVHVSGTKVDHKALAAVIDASQSYSALDLIRQALLTDYAQSDDLSALGRNLGVLRLPDVKGDTQFRAIIQAFAYNPKTSLYGLSIAMDALVGAGHYTIYEDLINSPCTVFISVPSSLFLDSFPQGKTYLTGTSSLPAAASVITYPFPAGSVTTPYARASGVRLRDINVWTDCRTSRPSASTDIRYVGDAGVPSWTYTGAGTETAAVAVTSPLGIAPTTNQVTTYSRTDPLLPASEARIRALFTITNGTPVSTSGTAGRQMGGRIRDTAVDMGWGVFGINSSTYLLAMINPQTGAGVGMSAILTVGTYYEVELHKRLDRYVELYINGVFIDRQPASAFPSTTSADITYGILTPSAALVPSITRYIGAYAHANTDFWSAQGTNASCSIDSPNTLTIASGITFSAGDVGRVMRLTGSAAFNSQNGNNNAFLSIATVISGTQVTLVGSSQTGAQVDSVHPQRITVNNAPQAFTYPDDLGKTITIENSVLGNGGTYTINRLYDPTTLVDLSTYNTRITVATNVCDVMGATFLPETGLSYHLTPVFATESGLSWDLSDAGSMVGPDVSLNYALTPRQALPYPNAVYDIDVNNVLSAQVVKVDSVVNFLMAPGPPAQFTYWPAYAVDPYNFVEQYIKGIVAAGVKVVFVFA